MEADRDQNQKSPQKHSVQSPNSASSDDVVIVITQEMYRRLTQEDRLVHHEHQSELKSEELKMSAPKMSGGLETVAMREVLRHDGSSHRKYLRSILKDVLGFQA